MRAYRLLGNSIELSELDDPKPGPTGILIRVHAASINRRDVMIQHGTYPLPARPGVIPLSDGAGEVVAVGAGVTRFAVGDRVTGSYWPRWRSGRLAPDLVDQLGCTVDGMATEYAVLDEQWTVRFAKLLGCKVIVPSPPLRNFNGSCVPANGASPRVIVAGCRHGAPEVPLVRGIATSLYGEIVLLIWRAAGHPNLVIPGEVDGPKLATIRRLFAGSRTDLEDMTRTMATRCVRSSTRSSRSTRFPRRTNGFAHPNGSERL